MVEHLGEGQGKRAKLLATAKTAADARLMLEALESGTDGVVLRTEDPAEVPLPLSKNFQQLTSRQKTK
jgi:3-dehydroquinate synthase class II